MQQATPHPAEPAGWSSSGRIERQLIAMMLQCPQMLPEIRECGLVDQFADPDLRSVGRLILEAALSSEDYVADTLLRVDRPELKSLVASLSLSEENWDLGGCRRLISQFEFSRKQQDRDLLQRIRQAEEKNDLEQLQRLLMEKQRLARKG